VPGFAPPENIRDVTFHEDTATSRTGSGPANLATIRAAIITAIKDAGCLHGPEGRRDHTTPAEALHLPVLELGQKRNMPEPYPAVELLSLPGPKLKIDGTAGPAPAVGHQVP